MNSFALAKYSLTIQRRRYIWALAYTLIGVVWLGLPDGAMGWSSLLKDGVCRQSKRACSSTVETAEACCQPEQNDVIQCAAQNPCEGTQPYHWDASSFPLKWYFNPDGSIGKYGFKNVTLATVEQALKTAWDSWSAPACSAFRHSYQGLRAEQENQSSRLVVFLPSPAYWAYLGIPTQVLAFSAPSAGGYGILRDADIVVNPSPGLPWGFPPVPTHSYDFTAVMTHEVGHSIGLGHTEKSDALMFYRLRSDGPVFAGLSADDKEAVCAVYPAQNACQSDADCGKCYKCTGGTCTPPDPPIARMCKPCTADAECGANGLCVDIPEGGRCLQRCSNTCCPSGYRCNQGSAGDFCVPIQGYCHYTKCQTDQECGRNSVCEKVYFTCVGAGTDAYKQCNNRCTTDASCGDPKFACVGFVEGSFRCVEKCPVGLCPKGFLCGAGPKGNHCLPLEVDYCPCRSNADCPIDRACLYGSCIAKEADFGEPCNSGFPCKKDLYCIDFAGGYRCSYDCSKAMPCPAGLECGYVPGRPQRCVKPPSAGLSESCDGVVKRCIDGLVCMRVSSGRNQAYCVEPCAIHQACSAGGKCDLNHEPRFCACQSDKDCADGLSCRTLATGYRVCGCVSPPCTRPCGNGVCEEQNGENCTTCPADCKCESGYGCTEGICRRLANCGDGICDIPNGETCSKCPQDCRCDFGLECSGNACVRKLECGDGVCSPDRQETCGSCPGDCPCGTGLVCVGSKCVAVQQDACGNGLCEPALGERCDTCPGDCGCGTDMRCVAGQCTKIVPGVCGNGVCEGGFGESCITCKSDCGCQNRNVCNKGLCVSADDFCPPAEQQLTCEPGGRNCKVVCQRVGCGCSQRDSQPQMPLFLLVLLALWGLRRGVKRRLMR